MKINSNNRQNFNGHIKVEFPYLDKKIKTQLIEEFKKEFGTGLSKRNYMYKNKNIEQDVFVGYNNIRLSRKGATDISSILIATGDDARITELNGVNCTRTKISKIDIPILDKVKNILTKLDINFKKNKEAEKFLEYNISENTPSGEIKHSLITVPQHRVNPHHNDNGYNLTRKDKKNVMTSVTIYEPQNGFGWIYKYRNNVTNSTKPENIQQIGYGEISAA